MSQQQTAAITHAVNTMGEAAPRQLNEFLTFRLGSEEYGIDILKVQEIRGYDNDAITQIANSPDFIKGVGNYSA